MGIDFSHTTAQWSYTGFGAFRRALALFEGFDLDEMVGFGGDREWSTIQSDWRRCSTTPTATAK